MALNAREVRNEGGGHRQEPLEAGAYPARVVQVVDLGVQTQRPFQGKEKPPAHMINVTYELLDEFCVDEEGNIEEDKPRWISERFPLHNLDQDKAKSTKRYYALDPEESYGGNWVELLGTPCIVTLTATEGKGKNKGKIFNNVASVSSMRPKEAAKAEPLTNDPIYFDLDDPDIDVFMSFPKFIQDIIKENLDFDGSDLEDAIANYKKPEEEEKKKDQEEKPKRGRKKKEEEPEEVGVDDAEETDDDW